MSSYISDVLFPVTSIERGTDVMKSFENLFILVLNFLDHRFLSD